MRRLVAALAALMALMPAAPPARADALESLREFSRSVKSGRATFTQTVTSPDGRKTKTSSGDFEFARPDRFRFAYVRPFRQLIVGDGERVWLYDPDLNQVSSRKMGQALGATPAALLAGTSLEKDFELKALPEGDGLSWVQALPRTSEGAFESLRVGFRGKELAVIDLKDNFGQRSTLRFDAVQTNVATKAEAFRFVVPPGAELIEQ